MLKRPMTQIWFIELLGTNQKRQKSYLSALQGNKEQDIPKASFFQRPSYLNYLPNFIPGSMTQVFPYVLYRSLVTKQSSLGYNLWFN